MVDSGVQGLEVVEVNEAPSPIKQHQQQKKWKTCTECGSSKTPLWRRGPDGPKTLCNACGIRRSKQKKTDLGPNKGKNNHHKKGKMIINGDGSSSSGESYEQRLMRLTNLLREIFTEKPKPQADERNWKMLSEEEQAALVLMSFSAKDCSF